ncbi:MAG: DUF402 domain-containing protein [Oscillospiraceae bacterium]|nr:DUF402 domain-containing protein [Oscillospiraceae bacterium]
MKIRDIKTLFRSGIKKQRFRSRPAAYNGASGLEALIIIEEVDAPKVISACGTDITISDRGYFWYQLALREKFFWLSAAFNAEGELIELYFDITGGNRFDNPEDPEFTDMYLDVVLTPSGDIRVLDRDELDEAFNDGIISDSEYFEAIEHCEELCGYLKEHGSELIAHCRRAASELLKII